MIIGNGNRLVRQQKMKASRRQQGRERDWISWWFLRRLKLLQIPEKGNTVQLLPVYYVKGVAWLSDLKKAYIEIIRQ